MIAAGLETDYRRITGITTVTVIPSRIREMRDAIERWLHGRWEIPESVDRLFQDEDWRNRAELELALQNFITIHKVPWGEPAN